MKLSADKVINKRVATQSTAVARPKLGGTKIARGAAAKFSREKTAAYSLHRTNSP